MPPRKEDELNSRPFFGGGGRFGGGGASASWGGATTIPTTVPNFPQVQQNSGYPVDLLPFTQRPMAMQYRPSTIPSMAAVGANMVNNIQPQLPAVPSEPPRIAIQPSPQRIVIPPLSPNPQQGSSTAMVRDWSKDPAVAAAMKTGNVAEIEKATKAARDAFRAGGVWAQVAKEVPLNPTPALQQRTPEQQQDLLAQMRERGAAIGERLAGEQRNRYYAFRQGIAERQAQEALTPSFGGQVGREGTMRGAQAMIEAERLKQVQAGRSPMSREPLTVGGLQFRQTSMGQFAPIRGFGNDWASSFVSGGPQPAQAATPAMTPPTVPQQLPPVIPDRSLGLSAESPLAFTPFGRSIGEAPMRTPEIPPITRSPFPRNVASSMTSRLGVPRFPYLGA